mmetsp:Transcript_27533/g.47150  ORF Transcript_27533/g.47150 Transcript_27533/m.47150 type:complete len:335 (-) Transcript_27533:5-1009(-)
MPTYSLRSVLLFAVANSQCPLRSVLFANFAASASAHTYITECASGCNVEWIGDGECDAECDVAVCANDGFDCRREADSGPERNAGEQPCRRNPAQHDAELWSMPSHVKIGGRHTFGVGEVLRLISRQSRMNKFVVDLGASVRGHGTTGVANQDSCFALFDAGYSGLMVDGDPKQGVKMRRRFPSKSIQIVSTLLSPENVAAILRRASTPIDADLVKIDIDGFDCAVMAALLEAYRPKVVQMEVNIQFPPPLRFALLSIENYNFDKRGMLYGCSLAYQGDMMSRHGYALLQMEANDAIYVQHDLLPPLLPTGLPPTACDAYMHGYAERPGVYHTF